MMTLKSKGLKIIIAIAVIMLTCVILNINDVYAVSEEDLQNILNIIPDTVELDVPEIEYDKSRDMLSSKIDELLKTNNINLEGITTNIWGWQPFDIDYFYKGGINLTANNNGKSKSKTITIKYNNTNNKNSTDEALVKGLEIEKSKYLEIDISKVTSTQCLDVAKEYYQKIVSDKSIVVQPAAASGGSSPLSSGVTSLYLMLFKNNNLYDVRNLKGADTIGVINVPSTISDNQLEEYVLNKINVCLEKSPNKDVFNVTAVKLSKGTGNENIKDGYTVTYDNDIEDYIIIRKEKNVIIPVSNTDITTNVMLDTTTDVVPVGTKIVAEKVTSGNNYNVAVETLSSEVAKFELFDISLVNNNAKIQPNGKVKVSIPVPAGYDTSKIVVYYVAEDGTKTKIDATIENGYIVFETDHFSNYVVAEEKTTIENAEVTDTATDTKSNEQSAETNDTNTTRKLDNTPKTGTETNIMSILSGIFSLVSAVGLIVVKKF